MPCFLSLSLVTVMDTTGPVMGWLAYSWALESAKGHSNNINCTEMQQWSQEMVAHPQLPNA